MKRVYLGLTLLSLALAGCPATETGNNTGKTGSGGDTANATGGDDTTGGDPSGSDATTTDASGDTIALTPDNTKIEFIGAHTDKSKTDNAGSFAKFMGTAKVADGALTSVEVEIETDSVTTADDMLTGHLKTADFFEVQEYPKATFKSTKIEDAGDGKVTITGDLTLLEATKPITFPATVSTDDGLTIESSFEIDRTDFGMDYKTEDIEKIVKISVTVGK